MFKHIVVGVDGSPTSALAVQSAIGLARGLSSEVTAVLVIDPYPFTGVGSDFAYGQAEYLSAANAEAAAVLKRTRESFEAAGLQVVTRSVESHATWRGILDAAAASHADLIILGSQGRHGLERLVLGSVTQAVLAHTQLPVLVVRG